MTINEKTQILLVNGYYRYANKFIRPPSEEIFDLDEAWEEYEKRS